jgi:hypothetical protein
MKMKATTALILTELARGKGFTPDEVMEQILWDWFVKHSDTVEQRLLDSVGFNTDRRLRVAALTELSHARAEQADAKRQLAIDKELANIQKHLDEIGAIEARLFQMGNSRR